MTVVAMVAGESSGDLLGAHLIDALSARRPSLSFLGIGGPRMQATGFESLFPMQKLAVRGYAEVARHYREIMGIRRALAERLLRDRPALFIGIDAPDFNLGLEERLRAAGVPTIHYVGPSIWAWRGGRIRSIARAVDRVLVLFPFEAPLYERAHIPVTYVGHPLADMIPLETDRVSARRILALPEGRRIVALLPGSRRSELHYMGRLFTETAYRLNALSPDLCFVSPAATADNRQAFEDEVRRCWGVDAPVSVLSGNSHAALAAADVALVASGTATLEAALLRTPMVIAYRMSPITWMLMRRMLYTPDIGLPNILAGRRVVPEFVQDQATAEDLAQGLRALLDDPEARAAQRHAFAGLHGLLRQDTAARAADAVLAML